MIRGQVWSPAPKKKLIYRYKWLKTTYGNSSFWKNQTAEMTASPWGSTADPGWQVSWWVGSNIRGNYPTWRTEKGGNKENWVTPGNRATSSVCMVESQKGKEKGEKMGQSAMASNLPKFYSFQKLQTRWCAGQWPISWNNPFALSCSCSRCLSQPWKAN